MKAFALALLCLGCGPPKEPCTANDLRPLEERYSTAIAEACADVELADCPAYEALSKEFAKEQDRVCR